MIWMFSVRPFRVNDDSEGQPGLRDPRCGGDDVRLLRPDHRAADRRAARRRPYRGKELNCVSHVRLHVHVGT